MRHFAMKGSTASILVTMMFFQVLTIAAARELLVPEAIFVFGDGALDVGNNIYLPGGAEVGEPRRADQPYYGMDFPGGTPTGRFSNGYNLADFIAKAFGFEMSPPASESLPNHSPTKMEGFTGVNYATGDAGIRNFTNGDITNPLLYQIGFFESTRSQLKSLLGGRKPLNNFLSKSLFLVGIGTMDLFPDYNLYWDTPQNDNLTEVQRLISLYGEALTTLHAMGARKFGIINVGPIGCGPAIPSVIQGEDGCNAGMNNVATQFNRALPPLLSSLRSKLNGFRYSLADFNGFTNATFTNPSASGFVNTQGTCWPGYLTPCSNRTEFWYRDAYGYTTEQAAKLAATAFYNGTKFTVPFNFTRLFTTKN
ncbi:hypothetical protein PR202_gb06885 [Eleusine coracana subsp. coracana]|uniref:GDSL esterase/lipase n=1 Tax=Eleusine coracana subsp. coracana TaxID=191504 RepID=A0AAV5EAI8_ELECO|nr:hypothetical protein QOZ80_2BG0163190 [Eleusine coracana subsp. coracana]GJN19595.1 hypothetical protein PR202_gb06885 [Eleusine coracana subsp. coracana]